MRKIKKSYINIINLLLTTCIVCFLFMGCDSNNQSGLVYGEENAPIEIINYTSFQCPDCVVMHERLHDSIKKYIEDGTVRFIEKPIDISRFEYDEVIYKHMTEEQSVDFQKLLEIYKTQSEWRDFEDDEEVIKFLNLSEDENKKNVSDLKVITKEKDKVKLEEVPTMFLNGEKISLDITVEEFEEKIENLLKAN